MTPPWITFPLLIHWMASSRPHFLRPSPPPKGYETLALWLVCQTHELRYRHWCFHPPKIYMGERSLIIHHPCAIVSETMPVYWPPDLEGRQGSAAPTLHSLLPHREIKVVRMSQQGPHVPSSVPAAAAALPMGFTVPKLSLKSWSFLLLIWWAV